MASSYDNSKIDLGDYSEKFKKYSEEYELNFNKWMKEHTHLFPEELTSIGLNDKDTEMKIERVNEEKIFGKIERMGYVVLDKEYNGTKTWTLDGIKGVNSYYFRQGTQVVVTFSGKKIVRVDDALEYTNKLLDQTKDSLEQVQDKKRKQLLPKDGFYISNEHQLILNAIKTGQEKFPEENPVLAIKGESGYGKTELALKYAQRNNKDFFKLNCMSISDNDAWFVNPEFKGGETNYCLTQFAEYLIRGNCVILLDELNRIHTYISNALVPILDDSQEIELHGINIKVGKKITFFATANEGSAYGGISPIDKAIQRRLKGTIVVGALPQDVECEILEKRYKVDFDVAKNIVKIMSRLRDTLKEYPVNVSTGTSLNVAFWASSGLSIRDAFKLAILNDAPIEAEKIILEALGLTGN